jgi:DNA-binding response OmpR family regulator
MSGQIIVIVEDDPTLVILVSQYLRDKGYEVYSARTGPEGLQLVQVIKPDLLLLDLMLPGLSGYEIGQRLRAIPAFEHLPILVMSALGDSDSMTFMQQLKVSGYLVKPVQFPTLLKEIQRVLEAEAKTEDSGDDA